MDPVATIADGQFQDAHRELDRAFTVGATRLDVFVPVRTCGVTLGFGARSLPDKITVSVNTIGDPDNDPFYIAWTREQDHTEFFAELDHARRRKHGKKKTLEIPADEVLAQLVHTLELAFRRKHEEGEENPERSRRGTRHPSVARHDPRLGGLG